jgi:hypothetical protein
MSLNLRRYGLIEEAATIARSGDFAEGIAAIEHDTGRRSFLDNTKDFQDFECGGVATDYLIYAARQVVRVLSGQDLDAANILAPDIGKMSVAEARKASSSFGFGTRNFEGCNDAEVIHVGSSHLAVTRRIAVVERMLDASGFEPLAPAEGRGFSIAEAQTPLGVTLFDIKEKGSHRLIAAKIPH